MSHDLQVKLLEAGDIIIDGGNSEYTDTMASNWDVLLSDFVGLYCCLFFWIVINLYFIFSANHPIIKKHSMNAVTEAAISIMLNMQSGLEIMKRA
jgi:hypothetical protein